jgi:hypothetical protein
VHLLLLPGLLVATKNEGAGAASGLMHWLLLL